MKPRKKWQPEYRFGGNPTDYCRPAALGTVVPYRPVIKSKRKKK